MTITKERTITEVSPQIVREIEETRTKVEVTQAMIDAGCQWDAGNCPFAKAFKALGLTAFLCHEFTVFLGVNGKYRNPPEMREWIDRFDSNLPVQPITIWLDIPAEAWGKK